MSCSFFTVSRCLKKKLGESQRLGKNRTKIALDEVFEKKMDGVFDQHIPEPWGSSFPSGASGRRTYYPLLAVQR